jgi:Glycosyl transferases group 1.
LSVDYFNKSLSNEWTLNIYGSGEEYDYVKSLENEKVEVSEYTVRNKLIELTSDIPFALVSLDPNLTIEGFPGKTFDYLSMNKIILCFANENYAVARFIEKYEVGINIDPKNLNNLEHVVEKLNSAHFIEESLNNVAILNKNEINKEKVIDKYLSLI